MGVERRIVIKALEEIALLLQLKGENPFKVRAYENAARSLNAIDEDLATLVAGGKLAEVQGVGKALVDKIGELVTTGRLEYLETLKAEFPEGLLDLLTVPGLGPKKVKLFYDALGICSVVELEAACRDGRIAALKGCGEKTALKIIDSIERAREHAKLFLFRQARSTAAMLIEELRLLPMLDRLEMAGSLRRYKEVTKDIDLVGSTANPEPVMKAFVQLGGVSSIIAHGRTKSSILLNNNLQVDLRLVEPHQFVTAFHHFTGSREHNVALRSRALKMNLRLSEWGLFRLAEDGTEGEQLCCHNEQDIYRHLGLNFVPPELREDMGEVLAAAEDQLPVAAPFSGYLGSLHNHTRASDGSNSIAELVEYALSMRHQYLGITDHSVSSFQANGLSAERLIEQVDEIRRYQKELGDCFSLLAGVECDIHTDGTLDYADDILDQLDYCIVAVHNAFSRTREEQTRRIVRAIEHPRSRILAHPSGRLLLRRDAYDIDMDRIIDAAAVNRVAIEFNCHPMRLDMDWRFWQKAKRKGVICSLNPDAHSLTNFDYIEDGLAFCRKGWLEPEDILNFWPPADVKAFLRQ